MPFFSSSHYLTENSLSKNLLMLIRLSLKFRTLDTVFPWLIFWPGFSLSFVGLLFLYLNVNTVPQGSAFSLFSSFPLIYFPQLTLSLLFLYLGDSHLYLSTHHFWSLWFVFISLQYYQCFLSALACMCFLRKQNQKAYTFHLVPQTSTSPPPNPLVCNFFPMPTYTVIHHCSCLDVGPWLSNL